MPIQPFSFGFETRKGKYEADTGARIINAYAQEAPPGSEVPLNIYARPGLASFASIGGTGGWRGGLGLDETRAYVIVGTVVYRITPGGSKTNVGSFPGTGFASMAANNRTNPHIAICSAGQRYLITTAAAADTTASISDGDLGAAIYVFWAHGYFIWLLANGTWQVSGLNDGTAYSATDIATAEADADGLVAGCSRGSEIVLFGTKTTQFYANVLDGTFPYTAIVGATIQLGCAAAFSLETINGVPIYVASDKTVRLLDGYSPVRISTHEIEQLIEGLSMTALEELRAWTFTLEGHSFYVLSSASWTRVCDLQTRLWFDWRSYEEDRWNVEGFVELSGKRIVGHPSLPELYTLSLNTQDDAGAHLIWTLISGRFGQFPYRMTVDELFCNLIPGVGLLSGADEDVDPEAVLRISDDDGYSWSDPITAHVGKIGEKSAQTSFTGLGTSLEDGFRFELSMSAAVARALTGAAIDYTPLKP